MDQTKRTFLTSSGSYLTIEPISFENNLWKGKVHLNSKSKDFSVIDDDNKPIVYYLDRDKEVIILEGLNLHVVLYQIVCFEKEYVSPKNLKFEGVTI